MMEPEGYWQETPGQKKARIAAQDRDRAFAFNDHMALIYEADLDEVFAELLRLHQTVGDARTAEILNRVFPERVALRASAKRS
jgi:hypothetical protein